MKKNIAIAVMIFALCATTPMLSAQEENKQPVVAAPAAGWLTNLEAAQQVAQKENKDILIDFTGSDWCGWCIKLHEEVFATAKWQEEAGKKYVLVTIDFPQKKELPAEQKTYNEKLASLFGIEGFPTIFLVDAAGLPYAKAGYEEGGPENYLKHLTELGKQKESRDQLVGEVAKETVAQKKIEMLEKLITTLDQWEVGQAYTQFKAQITDLDEGNKAGLLVKYGLELALYYHNKGDAARCEEYLQKVGKHDSKKVEEFKLQLVLRTIPGQYFEKEDWQGAQKALAAIIEQKLMQGEAAQEMYYYASVVEYHLKNKEKCLEYLQKALSSAPTSRAASYLEKVMKKLKDQETE